MLNNDPSMFFSEQSISFVVAVTVFIIQESEFLRVHDFQFTVTVLSEESSRTRVSKLFLEHCAGFKNTLSKGGRGVTISTLEVI